METRNGEGCRRYSGNIKKRKKICKRKTLWQSMQRQELTHSSALCYFHRPLGMMNFPFFLLQSGKHMRAMARICSQQRAFARNCSHLPANARKCSKKIFKKYFSSEKKLKAKTKHMLTFASICSQMPTFAGICCQMWSICSQMWAYALHLRANVKKHSQCLKSFS